MAQPADLAFSAWPACGRPATLLRSRPVGPVGAVEAASFEAHPEAQFVVTANGELLAANRAGRELVARSECVRVVGGHFVAGSGVRLRALCERIAASVRSQSPSPEIEIPAAALGTLSIRVFPLGASLDSALVVVREHQARPAGSVPERFGFTRAESLVAERLARGITVSEIALQLGISIDTVRHHLKQAFAKAGVHRQAELVAVMLGA